MSIGNDGTGREAQLDEIIGALNQVNENAVKLSNDVATLDEKTQRDRKIIASLQKVVRYLVAALVILTLIGIASFVTLVRTSDSAGNAERSATQLQDCLTPQGECAKRIAQSNEITLDILTLRIEDNRLTTQIEAAKASEGAGSTTAGATLKAYTDQQVQIRAQLEAKTVELQKVSPTGGPFTDGTP